jgi:hypothetical protein
MRKDMIKVVEEPARYSASMRELKGLNVRLRREGLDTRQREAVRIPWHYDDHRCQNTRVIHRYLAKQVGRPWDEVYSEVCAIAPKASFMGQRLRELVRDAVITRVMLHDGQLWGTHGFSFWRLYPGDLYVNPESKLLQEFVREEPKKRVRYFAPTPWKIVEVDGYHKYVKIEGLWYFVELSDIPGLEVTDRPWDAVFRMPVFPLQGKNVGFQNILVRTWEGDYYASGKRQASGREIAKVEAAVAANLTVLPKEQSARRKHRCYRPSKTA